MGGDGRSIVQSEDPQHVRCGHRRSQCRENQASRREWGGQRMATEAPFFKEGVVSCVLFAERLNKMRM